MTYPSPTGLGKSCIALANDDAVRLDEIRIGDTIRTSSQGITAKVKSFSRKEDTKTLMTFTWEDSLGDIYTNACFADTLTRIRKVINFKDRNLRRWLADLVTDNFFETCYDQDEMYYTPSFWARASILRPGDFIFIPDGALFFNTEGNLDDDLGVSDGYLIPLCIANEEARKSAVGYERMMLHPAMSFQEYEGVADDHGQYFRLKEVATVDIETDVVTIGVSSVGSAMVDGMAIQTPIVLETSSDRQKKAN